jgi:hypothetical protein
LEISVRTEKHWRKYKMRKKDKDSQAFRTMFGLTKNDSSWGGSGQGKTRGRKTKKRAKK